MLKMLIKIAFAGLLLGGIGLAVVFGMWYAAAAERNAESFSGAAERFVKSGLRVVEERLYREATEHNPAGDTLPDDVDDRFLEKIKSL